MSNQIRLAIYWYCSFFYEAEVSLRTKLNIVTTSIVLKEERITDSDR